MSSMDIAAMSEPHDLHDRALRDRAVRAARGLEPFDILLTGGDVAVSDPSIVLFPDMTKARMPVGPVTGSLLPDSNRSGQEDIVIGMSTLSNLHVYIAYKERNIYITPGPAL